MSDNPTCTQLSFIKSGKTYDIRDADAQAKLATKADKATTLAGYGITDAATSSSLNEHTSDNTIHVTASDKTTWSGKQDALESGTNIKTINNESILGSGNISVATTAQGALADTAVQPSDLAAVATNGSYADLTNKPTINSIELSGNKTANDLGLLNSNLGSENANKILKTDNSGNIIAAEVAGLIVDSEMSPVSINPVQNKVLYEMLYDTINLTPSELSPEKTAISSANGTVVTVSGASYRVKTFEIDPNKTYKVSAFAYSSAYAFYAYYKVVDDQEVPISWKSYKTPMEQKMINVILTDIPSDATLIKVAGNTAAAYKVEAALVETKESIEMLNERFSTLETTVNKDDKAVDEMFEVIEVERVYTSDFTLKGYYNKTDTSLLTNYNYHSTELMPVIEGQTVYWHNWKCNAWNIQAISLYDNDGLPYNGSNARKTYQELTTKDYDNGEFTLIIPQNCSQIGFSKSDTDNQEGYIQVGDSTGITFSDKAQRDIKSIMETTPIHASPSFLDFGVYYQRGAYNQSFDYSKKLCVLAGGQSNAAGRAPFIRFPFDLCGESETPTSPFTLPNVQYLGETEDFGNSKNSFSNATIRQKYEAEKDDNSWAFDSVIYGCLVNSSYGKQSDIHVVKRAVGGTSIDLEGTTAMHWTPDFKTLTDSQSLLRSLETYIRKAQTLQSSEYEIRAMVWHQGEGDCKTIEVANRYYANMKKMIAYIRGVVNNPYLLFYCGTISNNNKVDAYKNIVNAAINQIALEDPWVRVVNMNGAKLEDNYHFNYKACIYFGKAVYNMMVEDSVIQNGVVIENPLPDDWTE